MHELTHLEVALHAERFELLLEDSRLERGEDSKLVASSLSSVAAPGTRASLSKIPIASLKSRQRSPALIVDRHDLGRLEATKAARPVGDSTACDEPMVHVGATLLRCRAETGLCN